MNFTGFILSLSLLFLSGTQGAPGPSTLEYVSSVTEDPPLAIVREAQMTVDVKSTKKMVVDELFTIEILDPKANHAAILTHHFDESCRISKIAAQVWSADGTLIKSYDRSDFADVSAISDNDVFADDRMLYADLRRYDYPYTISYTLKTIYDHNFFLPVFRPAYIAGASAERSKLEVHYSKDIPIRFATRNVELEPIQDIEDDRVTLRWEFKDIAAIHDEQEFKNDSPRIRLSPTDFNYEGYEGDLSSWYSFGRWIQTLNHERSDLDQDAIDEIRNRCPDSLDPADRISCVYEYVQENTRYVSIQLGIGGFMPFKSSVVHEKGFGDCKALSFYTQSLLQAVDIPSNYCIVYGGRKKERVDPSFPANYFNHAILCVPNAGDTTWLECTSDDLMSGDLGIFTEDRYALLITDNGGELVRTPPRRIRKRDELLRKADVHIDENGVATAEIHLEYVGYKADRRRLKDLAKLKDTDLRKWVMREVGRRDLEIEEVSARYLSDKGVTIVELKGRLRKQISVTPSRWFLDLQIFDDTTFSPDEDSDEPMHVDPFVITDSVTISWPEHLLVSGEVRGNEVSTPSDRVSIDVQMNVNEIEIVRSHTHSSTDDDGMKEATQAEIEFHRAAKKLDGQTVILMKKGITTD